MTAIVPGVLIQEISGPPTATEKGGKLVGDFCSNPIETYNLQIGSFPQGSG